jgi:dipeptidyl aminopeptidase/acylaminoacyl peptidase
MMKKVLAILFSIFIITCLVYAEEKRPITVEDLWSFGRVSDPQISPDGKTVAFVITYYCTEENRGNSDIWLIDIAGGEPHQLTTSKAADFQPCWSPCGKKIVFVSTRSGSAQLWCIKLAGGEAQQISTISTGAYGPILSPDGKWIAFSSNVFPDCKDDECNHKRNEEREKSKVKARVINKLLYRHWDSWTEGKRSHLFIMPAEGGKATDITPWDYDVPPIALGGSQDYVFSPDSKEICFVMNTDPMVAISTNNDLFTIPISGGEYKRVTTNKGNDNQPLYSPDGCYIAFGSMERAGFEADRLRLMLYERENGRFTELTTHFDRSVSDVVWAPDSSGLYFTCQDEGYFSLYWVSVKGGPVKKLMGKRYMLNLRLAPDGKNFVFTYQTINHAAELFLADAKTLKLRQLTDINEDLENQLEMTPLEEFWFKSTDGLKIHGFLVKPPQFDAKKKYPLVYLIHGGPQGAWGDDFHYRWNAQMFAAPGYVVAMVNFRGSTGYGQNFTDRITGDWGGMCYEDLMTGLDYVLDNYDFIDKEKIAAAGASFGGYMINWIAGHTDRFNCLINHDGIYNKISMYGTTEELWFEEWEFKGTPWDNPTLYEKWSPHKFAKNFKTPMLIVHGEQDFRVPVSEGLQAFTTLQRQGIPSKLLYFPDEGHWVLKPLNAKLWWETVYQWLAEYLK